MSNASKASGASGGDSSDASLRPGACGHCNYEMQSNGVYVCHEHGQRTNDAPVEKAPGVRCTKCLAYIANGVKHLARACTASEGHHWIAAWPSRSVEKREAAQRAGECLCIITIGCPAHDARTDYPKATWPKGASPQRIVTDLLSDLHAQGCIELTERSWGIVEIIEQVCAALDTEHRTAKAPGKP